MSRPYRTSAGPDGLLDGPEPAAAHVPLDGEPRGIPPRVGTFVKIGTGMATLLGLIVSTYVVPALHGARPWTSDDPVLFWNVLGRELLDAPEELAARRAELEAVDALSAAAARPQPCCGEADREGVDGGDGQGARSRYQPHPDDEQPVPLRLELPQPGALDRFFAQLARTEAAQVGAVTRVTHWGDSVIAGDYVTSTLRHRIQSRFGDAGHGWHLISTPTLSYRHRGIRFKKGDWANCYIINGCRKDGHYGLGGTMFTSKGGSRVTLGTARKGSFGRKVSRFELWYAAEPRGGPIEVRIDGGDPVTVEGRAAELADAYAVFEVPDGPHQFHIRAPFGRGRLYGAVLEREGPGVVWDGMSNLGAFTGRMLHADPDHLHEQIDRRDPDLLVFQFGGNDLLLKPSKYGLFERQTREMLQLYRGDNPGRACLVISPVDHGERKGLRTVSVAAMEPITDIQRRVALEQGCAFYDTRTAMGGDGAIAVWRQRGLMSADLAHLSEQGQQVLGHMIYLALMRAYRDFRERPPSNAAH